MNEHITTVQLATADQAHDARPSGLSLHCPDAATWAGSFGMLVTDLLSGVLADGPVDGTVYAQDDHGNVLRRYVGRIVAVTESRVIFRDGVQVTIENAVSLFI